MRKLHRRRCLELSLIGAALALIAASPAGALAAGEESGGSSTPGDAVVESPGGSAEPTAPAPSPPAATAPAPGWTSEGAGTGSSSTGAPSIRHGSSVGSGGVPETAPSSDEGSSTGSGSSDYYEPAPSTSVGVEEPGSAPRAASEASPVEPPAPAPSAGKAAELAVGAAAPLTFTRSSQGDDVSSGSQLAAATFPAPGDQGASSSYLLPLLIVAALGLLGYAGVRLRRRHWRRRLEAVRRQREVTWKAVVRQIETKRALGTLEPSAERLQKIDVG